MNKPRTLIAGPFLLAFVLLAASCGGIAKPQGWARPVIDGNTTYIFRAKDKFSAIDFGEGGKATVRWTFPDKTRQNQKDIKIEAVYGAPIVDGDRVYVAAYEGDVFAIATKDAELLWRANNIEGSIVGGPVLAGDVLYFGTTKGRLYAINRSDGKPTPNWPSGGVKFSDGVWAAPAVGKEALYVATMGGEVYALKFADGSRQWPKPFKASGAVASIALLDESHLFVGSLNKQVYIVDTASGAAPGGGFRASDWVWTQPAFKDGVAYFGDFSGRVYALDITTNQLKWTYDARHRVKSGPALVGDVLVLSDRSPIVHFIQSKDGTALNTVPLLESGTIRADVAPENGTALIVTTSGKLFRADPKTRSVLDVPVGVN